MRPYQPNRLQSILRCVNNLKNTLGGVENN